MRVNDVLLVHEEQVAVLSWHHKLLAKLHMYTYTSIYFCHVDICIEPGLDVSNYFESAIFDIHERFSIVERLE